MRLRSKAVDIFAMLRSDQPQVRSLARKAADADLNPYSGRPNGYLREDLLPYMDATDGEKDQARALIDASKARIGPLASFRHIDQVDIASLKSGDEMNDLERAAIFMDAGMRGNQNGRVSYWEMAQRPDFAQQRYSLLDIMAGVDPTS